MIPPDEIPIPRDYHSDYEERPFISCTRCGECLEAVAEGYQIVKFWHNDETTCEYALCHCCHAGLLSEFSAESRQKLEEFHAEHVNPTRGPGRCAVCGCLKEEIQNGEFSRTACVRGNTLELEILICGVCSQSMQEMMSTQTRGVWERFLQENFPLAPVDSLPEPTLLLKL